MTSKSQRIRQLTILGPGLLGGSIGLAVKKRKLADKVVVWGRRIESARAAVKRGAADFAADTPADAVRGSDLVILCTPVETMAQLAREFRQKLLRESIVTDIGSTKYDIVKHLSSLLSGRTTYIGSHPMAGSERDGLAAAQANLFEGAVCILTPPPRARTAPLKKLANFWESLGCRLRTTSPAEHDEIVAYISHLPHLAAYSLIGTIPQEHLEYAAQGLKDTTRIAASSPQVWSDISMANKKNIVAALDEMVKNLGNVRKLIVANDQQNLINYFKNAKTKRDTVN